MNVDIADSIRNQPGLKSAVEQATDLLEREMRNTAVPTSVHWNTESDEHDRPVLALTLADRYGVLKERFDLKEWKNPSRLQSRLHRLWGDMLQMRSQKQVEKLIEMMAASNGE
ncbi:MAG: hypothetical protein L0Y72_13945 [Gemmataceae bacterium]|nr:hypothetical protein [Gemmataceae bacterium]MCI0740144.1 hypothetical protein [Gemmataceae bacterium]